MYKLIRFIVLVFAIISLSFSFDHFGNWYSSSNIFVRIGVFALIGTPIVFTIDFFFEKFLKNLI